MTSWTNRRRVLLTVATGGQPGQADAVEVDELVERGLLQRDAERVALTALGRDVVNDEPGSALM